MESINRARYCFPLWSVDLNIFKLSSKQQTWQAHSSSCIQALSVTIGTGVTRGTFFLWS